MIAVVCGLRRSGTSLVAYLLQEMGVVMSEVRERPTSWNLHGMYEDQEFVTVLDRVVQGGEVRDGRVIRPGHPDALTDLRALIAKRKARYSRWGVKNFGLNYLLPEFVAQCGEPVHLIVTRRPFSASVNSYISRSGESLDATLQKFSHDLYNVDIVYQRHDGPKMEVQFSELIAEPLCTVRILAGFVGVPFTEEIAGLVDPGQRHF